uniref:Sec-independent protein translocase protein TatC n=1 Tax=Candidatus Methanogaster sp. ANME-2c ERB4 TaxID=2759911 RepID=A0A7G9Y3E7_9EURY|nr:Sec-independent protein translocase protein TatC [Methanosarcinales archaeon ANME-2c ERB4]
MDGVPGDENVPLLDHITELRSRLIIVVFALCISAAIVYPFSGTLIHNIWNDLLPEGTRMVVYAPLELTITKLTLSFTIAFAVGTPLLMYELLAFVGKGLYPSEKRFFMKIVPLSFLLFLSGAVIAYFVIVPVIFKYMILHSGDLAVAGLSLKKTFSVVATLLLGSGLVFQFPVLVIAAIKMGLHQQISHIIVSFGNTFENEDVFF